MFCSFWCGAWRHRFVHSIMGSSLYTWSLPMLICMSWDQGTQGEFSHVSFNDESIQPIACRHDSRWKRNGQRNGLSWDDKWTVSLITPLHRVFPYGETRSLKLDTTYYINESIYYHLVDVIQYCWAGVRQQFSGIPQVKMSWGTISPKKQRRHQE